MKLRWAAAALMLLLLMPAWALAETTAGNYDPGDVVTVRLIVAGNPNLAVAASIELEYDHSVFELIPSNFIQKDRAFLMDMNGISAGTEYEVFLRARRSAPNGIYRVTVKVIEAGDIYEKYVDGLEIAPVLIGIGLPTPSPVPTQTPRPTFTPTPKPTKKPTPTPTKKPTPSPSPTPSRNFAIDAHVIVANGKVTVNWKDSQNLGPYKVAFQCTGGTARQVSFWGASDESTSTTSSKFFTFTRLIPGNSYLVKVYDKNGTMITREITVPKADSFVDGKLKASSMSVTLTPKYRNSQNTVCNLSSFSHTEMEKYLKEGTRSYGVRYDITVPKLASAREYFEQLVFYSPDGFVLVEYAGNDDYTNTSGSSNYYWSCIGDTFFSYLYEFNGAIPTGTYRIELYWNGMLAQKRTFTVH